MRDGVRIRSAATATGGNKRAEAQDRERAGGRHDDEVLLDGRTIVDAEIEDLQDRIAAKLGYELRGHRLELYGVPLKSKD